MPANLTNHAEIIAVQTRSGNTPKTNSINEKAGQTFLKGVPVQLNAGVIQEWDATVAATGSIAGITLVDASNLATDGAGAPGPFTPIGFPGTGTTFGKVPYEASAVNIPRGAPFQTGQTLFEEANDDTVFSAQFDNASGAVAADYTPVQSDIGKQYGMTKDANGHWYVDKAKVTVGTNTVLVIYQIDPVDGSIVNARVWFTFLQSISQLTR